MNDSDDPMMATYPPSDASPPKRRGRPPGSGKKPPLHLLTKPAPGELEVDVTAFLVMLSALDFTALGSDDRTLLVLMRDTSPSEIESEGEFRESGNAIPAVLAADQLAASRVDVLLAHGAEDLEFVACEHSKNFRMPDKVTYGKGTHAAPWFQKIIAAVRAYEAHLAEQGMGVKGVYVVFASDFRFGDHFVPALEEFRAFQRAHPKVVVIPAGHGAWIPEVAEKVSVREEPIDLNELRITDFIRIIAESVREVSSCTTARAEEILHEKLKALRV